MQMSFRITDDLMTIIATLSEGNPGAVTVLVALADRYQNRPLVFAEAVRMFESLKLRGAGIYMLWNDCLDRNTSHLVYLIEDWRHGDISGEDIIKHINVEGGRGLRIPEVGRWLY